ncbi:MAG: 1-acyl-sn-glycerol-3-phosphate acyltransferase [Thermoproteota archaeon]|jgi:1-acyl-sn-glycerol-3-phosphate acyltransferase
MSRYISFIVLSTLKILSHLFFPLIMKSHRGSIQKDWKDIKFIIFLNHTSLYEPLFLAAMPWPLLWKVSKYMVAPGADVTLNRPIVGWFYKHLSSNIVSISRERDHTWVKFLEKIHVKNSVILILPEGRMMRKNGLDRKGKPMSCRGGVVDILNEVNEGKILFCYSGGLHHVQYPGKKIPKVFKKIFMDIEIEPVKSYKEKFTNDKGKLLKLDVVADLEKKIKDKTPRHKLSTRQEDS